MTDKRVTLFVEDEPDDILLITRAINKANFKSPIINVNDGEQALAYLKGDPPYDDREKTPLPALILLDLKLPRTSGFEILSWIREQPATQCIPVVVLTSSKDSADIRRAYEIGANSYLVKPVVPDDVQNMIKTLGLYWLVLNEYPVT